MGHKVDQVITDLDASDMSASVALRAGLKPVGPRRKTGGFPIREEFWATLESMGGVRWLLEQRAAGVTLKAICEAVDPNRTSLFCLTEYVKHRKRDTPGFAEDWEDAKKVAAAGHVDDAMQGLDDLNGKVVSREDIQLAQARAKVRLWRASREDRETYGDVGTSVNINSNNRSVSVGSLHVDAFKSPLVLRRPGEAAPALSAGQDALPAIRAAEAVEEAVYTIEDSEDSPASPSADALVSPSEDRRI